VTLQGFFCGRIRRVLDNQNALAEQARLDAPDRPGVNRLLEYDKYNISATWDEDGTVLGLY